MRTATSVIGGILLLLGSGWVLLTRAEVLRHVHPVQPSTLIGVAVAGLLLVAAGIRHRRRVRRTASAARARSRPRRVLTGACRVLLTVVALAVAVGLVALRPYPATAAARAALVSDARVRVDQHRGTITFTPTEVDRDAAGLVFTPGARVDPRAYAALLRPLAEAGHVVVVVPPPFGIALLSPDQSDQAVAAHPEVSRWYAGGHSLGGVSASVWAGQHAGAEADGLLLWASYPLGDLSGADLRTCTVSGSQDGLLDPAELEQHRAQLPADTDLTEVEGGVHAFFGDYGPQAGDGVATTSRAEAQATIVAASLACLG